MNELPVDVGLVGREVRSAARPEWGVGKVLRVQRISGGDAPVFRVSVQFAVGHRTLVAPPAKLLHPEPEEQRESGWLESLGGTTLDDRLRALPESVTQFLGTPRDRIAIVAPLFAFRDDPGLLLRWARDQTGLTDPLEHWTRDELQLAFEQFCYRRDEFLRGAAAALARSAESCELDTLLTEFEPPIGEAIRRALPARK